MSARRRQPPRAASSHTHHGIPIWWSMVENVILVDQLTSPGSLGITVVVTEWDWKARCSSGTRKGSRVTLVTSFDEIFTFSA